MPEVLVMWSARSWISGGHSGWATSSALGCSILERVTSSRVSWTWWTLQNPSQAMILFFVRLAAKAERFRSGMQMTVSSLSDSTTFTTFDEVQQMSLSALTAAEVFTYATTGTPGCCALMSRRV